jgi:hypothetical protein
MIQDNAMGTPEHAILADLKETILLDVIKLNAVKSLFHSINTYYQSTLTRMQLQWYAEDMMSYAIEEVQEAMVVWRRMALQKGHKPRAPLPADLISLINPATDTLGEANLLANKLWGALGIGYNHPKEAREHLGELVWDAVSERGGWVEQCRAKTEDQHVFVAQWRDYLRAKLEAEGSEAHKQLRAEAQRYIAEKRQHNATQAISEIGNVIKQVTAQR